MRTITCGAILAVVVEACGGEDGVLASSEICSLLVSPASLFRKEDQAETNEEVIGSKLMNKPAETLAPLCTWLEDFIRNSPNITSLEKRLGDRVWELIKCMAENLFLSLNQGIPDPQPLTINGLINFRNKPNWNLTEKDTPISRLLKWSSPH